jgi:hypothetical protein
LIVYFLTLKPKIHILIICHTNKGDITLNNNRQFIQPSPTLFTFLTGELSLPCLDNSSGFIRVFNALPSDAKFDVYIGDVLLAKELAYKQFSFYIPGSAIISHNIRVFNSLNPNTPIIDTQIEITPANVETVCINGTIQNPKILKVTGDPTQQTYRDKASIRYANLTKDTMIINVATANNIIAYITLKPDEYNSYLVADPGIYRFRFIEADSPNNNNSSTVSHTLNPTRIYTFYLVGELGPNSKYPLELVISVDITTVIKTCPPDMIRHEKNGLI